MECPTCGYLFQPFEQDCPRCRRQQSRANAVAPPAVKAVPLPAAPLPVAPASPLPRPVRSKRGNGVLVGVVAVLSIACIYLSGLVLGNYMAEQKSPPVSTVYVPRPPASSPVPVANVPSQPDWFTRMRMQEIQTFLAEIQKLETQRHAVLLSHAASTPTTPQPQALILSEGPTAVEPRLPLPVARVSLEQLHTESSHMQQLRANMEGIRAPDACISLRSSYNAYWREITAYYDKLLYARHIEESDPTSSRDTMEFLNSTGIENLREAAKKADQDLTWLCAGQRIPKPFTID